MPPHMLSRPRARGLAPPSQFDPEGGGVADDDCGGLAVLDETVWLGDKEAQVFDRASRDEVDEPIARLPSELGLLLVELAAVMVAQLLCASRSRTNPRADCHGQPLILFLAPASEMEHLEFLSHPLENERLEPLVIVLLPNKLSVSFALEFVLEPRV